MPFIIAIDYDDTLFEGISGQDGPPKQDVIDKTKEFIKEGAEVALWTCREGKSLEIAEARCKEYGLNLISINENTPTEVLFQEARAKEGDLLALRKIYADIYVDDKAPGSIEYYLAIDVKKTCESFKDRGLLKK